MLLSPQRLTDDIFLIDAYDLKRVGRTGSYVIKDDKITLIETSASPSVPYILEGLKQLNVNPEDISYIIVTHIHLDHAGGCGLLLDHCPNAKVIVHPKGARHLIDPSKLIAGAKMVYGKEFEKLFSPIIPIQEGQIIVMHDKDTLNIGTRNLIFLDTPGHANHHFSMYDPKSKGIFTGDTVGIFYHETQADNIRLYLPSTSPNQFNPEVMMHSIDKLADLEPSRIYFGHFGMTEDVEETFSQVKSWIPKFVETATSTLATCYDKPLSDQIIAIKNQLLHTVKEYSEVGKLPQAHPIFEILSLDLQVCAMGLIDYLKKKEMQA
ncbi:MBL fold metallo-hydrolase [Bacillus sp. HMF5848]|uniref:MBL fold metallo-hydrolase n=1 Tax=Bacillus sp. HMF5848 TaxID=2495421 RepID=UPI000F7B5817|nr:MBL fold metallo-hydrolase [Bacillus sp. HMF5848]RSK26845.1 MBL fold metallo-hydrolase [Bacillus sp. HMF5848]